jgi:hypothetical protein
MKEDPGYQAFRVLQAAFVVAPIVAGLDKFFNFLANWSQYLSPMASRLLQSHERLYMGIAGVVEIAAGIGMIFKPKLFSYIISIWLLLIIVNLLQTGHYYDVALRDVGLMLAAFATGRLSQKYCESI